MSVSENTNPDYTVACTLCNNLTCISRPMIFVKDEIILCMNQADIMQMHTTLC